jgi:hypothetical protein
MKGDVSAKPGDCGGGRGSAERGEFGTAIMLARLVSWEQHDTSLDKSTRVSHFR